MVGLIEGFAEAALPTRLLSGPFEIVLRLENARMEEQPDNGAKKQAYQLQLQSGAGLRQGFACRHT